MAEMIEMAKKDEIEQARQKVVFSAQLLYLYTIPCTFHTLLSHSLTHTYTLHTLFVLTRVLTHNMYIVLQVILVSCFFISNKSLYQFSLSHSGSVHMK